LREEQEERGREYNKKFGRGLHPPSKKTTSRILKHQKANKKKKKPKKKLGGGRGAKGLGARRTTALEMAIALVGTSIPKGSRVLGEDLRGREAKITSRR